MTWHASGHGPHSATWVKYELKAVKEENNLGRPTRPHILVEPSPSKSTANKEELGSILGGTNNNSHIRRDRTKKYYLSAGLAVSKQSAHLIYIH